MPGQTPDILPFTYPVYMESSSTGTSFVSLKDMKNLILIVAVALSFTSCQQIAGYFNNESSDSAKLATDQSLIVERDLSINQSNSYSDLFLDSTAVENYISKNNLSDTIAREMRNFYNGRNLQFAWMSSGGLTEQGRGFWSLADRSNTKEDAFGTRMDSLASEDSLLIQASDSSYAQTELKLTEQFLRYKDSLSAKTAFANNIFIPVKKQDVLTLADSILKIPVDTNSTNPSLKQYAKLKDYLRKYRELASGDTQVKITKNIKKGSSSAEVAALKRYLYLTGDYTTHDTSQVYNDSLNSAIRSYQKRNRLKEDGVITDSMAKMMNVSAEERMRQIIINMNRLAWAPEVNQDYLLVNIPEYRLKAYEGGTRLFDMDVIVGKEGTNTVMFTGNLNEIVFNPYWNIPESIVREEIMPAMKKDATYLKKNNMEVVSQKDSIPVIRQLPGDDNALGNVKFLFPNSYDIYLHDTPHKNLFNKKDRALSHGCIRVADAQKLAQHLLKDQSAWNAEKISEAMKGNKEQSVKLSKEIPVVIAYYTAWVDDDGRLQFRDDVYGHDSRTAQMMFTGVPTVNNTTMPADTSKRKS